MQYKDRYEIVTASQVALMSRPPVPTKGKASTLKKLIREVISSDEDDAFGGITTGSSHTDYFVAVEPWRAGFNAYIDTIEADVPKGMSTVEWWGVSLSLRFIYSMTN